MDESFQVISMTPFFLAGGQADLFCICSGPAKGRVSETAILHLPPFAEEMNKSRRMVALQARVFARLGFSTLVVDPCGTGDSGGDFADATWQRWCHDLVRAGHWLLENGASQLVLWSLRAGALQVPEVHAALAKHCKHILLWQPIINGDLLLAQFFRIRLAADMFVGAGTKVSDLHQSLMRGEPVEVGGYLLAPQLYQEIRGRSLMTASWGGSPNVCWLEVAAGDRKLISTASARVVDAWRSSGLSVSAETIQGAAFWNAVETTVVDALLGRTGKWVEGVLP